MTGRAGILGPGRFFALKAVNQEAKKTEINQHDAERYPAEQLAARSQGNQHQDGRPERDAKAAVESESFQRFLREQNLDLRPGWLGREAYKVQWDSEYADLSEIFGRGGAS